MKNFQKNNANSGKNPRLTPFENVANAAKKRAILAKIHAETQQIIDSYEHLETISEATEIELKTLERYADEAIIELAEAMENEFGVSA